MLKAIATSLERQQLQTALAKGPLACPQCGATFAGRPSDPSEVLTCESCSHFASAAEWAAGNLSPAGKIGRAGNPPAGTRIRREEIGTTVAWDIPPSGKSGGLLVFGWVWTAFIAIFTSIWTWGAVAMASDPSKHGPSWLSFLFLLPFWAVGLGMLYAGYRMKNARHKVVIGEGKVTLAREWRGETHKKSLPLAGLETIQQAVFYSKNYTPVYGIEFKGNRGKLRFGSALEEAEKAWLVAEFKQAAWPVEPHEPAQSAAGEFATQKAPPQGRTAFSVPVPQYNQLANTRVTTAMGIFFVGISRLIPANDPTFRTVFASIGCLLFVAGLAALIAHFRNRHVEHRIEGNGTHLFLRKTRKGLTLSEESFPRESFRDIRAITETTMGSQATHEPRVKIELLLDRAIILGRLLNPAEAAAFVAAVKQAIG